VKIALASNRAQLAEALHNTLPGSGHRVCGLADSQPGLLELLQHERPQALLLDVALFGARSVDVIREIMSSAPCAVLLVTKGPEDRLTQVYEAMGAGAVDVVGWSSADTPSSADVQLLLAKLATVTKLLGSDGTLPEQSSREPLLVAIGASTGGPQAVVDVLLGLPKPVRAAIVVVQHVDREFAQGFAAWLETQTRIPTELALPHSAPKRGVVLVAATNDHLVMTASRTFSYTPNPRELAYRPSVDVLFRSLARHWLKPGVAVVLTGMGRDGADGLLMLRRARWLTIAQDEQSSVVFGMPKAAIELGAASRVLPVSEIGRAIGVPR
jgi:two-component system response regulator WspF